MGAMDARNMYTKPAVNKYLHTVVSCWILLVQSHDARNREYKIHQSCPVSNITHAPFSYFLHILIILYNQINWKRGRQNVSFYAVNRLQGWTIQDSNPGRGKRFLFSQKVQKGSGVTQPPINGYKGLFRQKKIGHYVRIVDQLHLAPKSKMSGVIPPVCVHAFMACTGKTAYVPTYYRHYYLLPTNIHTNQTTTNITSYQVPTYQYSYITTYLATYIYLPITYKSTYQPTYLLTNLPIIHRS